MDFGAGHDFAISVHRVFSCELCHHLCIPENVVARIDWMSALSVSLQCIPPGRPWTHFESVELGTIVMNLKPFGMSYVHLYESEKQSGAPAHTQKSYSDQEGDGSPSQRFMRVNLIFVGRILVQLVLYVWRI